MIPPAVSQPGSPVSPPAPGAAEIRAWRQIRVFWAAVALLLLLLAPFGGLFTRFLFACPFKALTGLPCPTCGATRSALALAHFDLAGALLHYPLPSLAWLFLIGGGLLAGLSVFLGIPVPPPPQRMARWQRWLLIAALLANWAYSIATGV